MTTAPPFRVVFFGTPAFAVPTLDALLASSHTVVGVVTQPDRPKGRGQQTSDGPVKARARVAGLPLLQPVSLKDRGLLGALGGLGADIGVVAAYGKILTDAVLAMPRLGLVNVHASLLPRYRGAAPVHRAVIAGEPETGVTIMRVVRALDAGPMLATAIRSIGPNETSADVERDLAVIGASLLADTLNRMHGSPVPEIAQVEADATYAPRLTKGDGLVDWSRPARDIHNLIRGLHPWPHAFTFFDSRRLILRRSRVVNDPTNQPAGTVVAARADRFRVAAGADQIEIVEVQAEGARPMAAGEFLAGHPIAVGTRLRAAP